MGDFSADWLALREPADHAARSAPLVDRVAESLHGDDTVRVLDLGAGTGSNLRYLAPRLGGPQHWLLADRDADLLANVRVPALSTVTVETCAIDLRDIDGDRTTALFDGCGLVTASALLDLVSDRWVRAVAARCRHVRAAVLFVLSYDGRLACTPRDAADDMVRGLVNDHQRRDKGFGPALGPQATMRAEQAFGSLGYHTERAGSDWVIGPDARDLQRALIEGWATAANGQGSARSIEIRAWRARRLDHVSAGRSQLRVGHEDLAAWLPDATHEIAVRSRA